jgi:ferredoxin/flavodoxin---NADP+ reductase
VSADSIVDITILGAGPSGLAAAYYAGHRDASVRIIESLEQLGGQVAAVYPEKHVYDVAGHPKIMGTKLVELCAEQGLQYGPEVLLGEEVQTLERLSQNGEELFAIGTDKGGPYLSRVLIITAGHGAFEPRKLGIEGIEDWEDKGVHYFVREGRLPRPHLRHRWRRRLRARLDARSPGHREGADRARPPPGQLPRARVLGERGARAGG